MEGAPGTLYEGEKFQLLFKFSPKYPFDSPEVGETVGLYLFHKKSSIHVDFVIFGLYTKQIATKIYND